MSHVLFGPWDKIFEDHKDSMVPCENIQTCWPSQCTRKSRIWGEFEIAMALETGGYLHPKTGEPTPFIVTPFINVGSLRGELQKLPREICSKTCIIIDFVEHLLVIDPTKRPTAEIALQHPFVSSVTV
jgi:serine/threonine protein kinase